MTNKLVLNGYPSVSELKEKGKYPSDERFAKGAVAVIECLQEIPCNPCEAACPMHAITVGEPITSLPCLDEEKCIGCGKCVAMCSGQAIFIVDKTWSETEASVSFPHEYLPLPEKGQKVSAVNRGGEVVCEGTVIRVVNPASYDCTPVVTLAVPRELADEVRGMRRIGHEDCGHACIREFDVYGADPDDRIVCRCEEVTAGEIRRAIADGASSLTAVKRRTRAGMGLCQGRTCSKTVSSMLAKETGKTGNEILPDTVRMPVTPVSLAVLAGRGDAGIPKKSEDPTK